MIDRSEINNITNPMVNKITVLGLGTMGDGLAKFFAGKKVAVTGYDINRNLVLAAGERAHCDDHMKKYLSHTTDLKAAVSEADLIIESVSEDLQIKTRLFQEISPWIKENAIVASNTSTFPLVMLGLNQAFANRIIIMHFFNPPDLIPLVEVVQSENGMPGLTGRVSAFLRRCGKVPVILKKDIHGFIANRLQAAVLREACFLVEGGVADVEDIDAVMTEALGIRWAIYGPFGIADLGGLDIWEKVCGNLFPRLSTSKKTPSTMTEKVQAQKLGLKSGQGFYKYEVAGDYSENYRQKIADYLKLK